MQNWLFCFAHCFLLTRKGRFVWQIWFFDFSKTPFRGLQNRMCFISHTWFFAVYENDCCIWSKLFWSDLQNWLIDFAHQFFSDVQKWFFHFTHRFFFNVQNWLFRFANMVFQVRKVFAVQFSADYKIRRHRFFFAPTIFLKIENNRNANLYERLLRWIRDKAKFEFPETDRLRSAPRAICKPIVEPAKR